LRLEIAELSEVLSDQLLAHFIIPVLTASLIPETDSHSPIVQRPLALFILTQVRRLLSLNLTAMLTFQKGFHGIYGSVFGKQCHRLLAEPKISIDRVTTRF
jgi:hypothetical protein